METDGIGLIPPCTEEVQAVPAVAPSLKDILAVEFYRRDDVSRLAPGKKDFVVVSRTPSGNEHAQKRHMLMSLHEACFLFNEAYAEQIMRRSKFSSLRPPEVCLSKDLPHNVCCCKTHEDLIR
jgi:hypothetical protein